jgi:hypothetical protein
VRQVETRAESNLEDDSFRWCEQTLPLALKAFAAQYPIHESGENICCIHGLTCSIAGVFDEIFDKAQPVVQRANPLENYMVAVRRILVATGSMC